MRHPFHLMLGQIPGLSLPLVLRTPDLHCSTAVLDDVQINELRSAESRRWWTFPKSYAIQTRIH